MNISLSKLKWRYATQKFDSSKKLSDEQLNHFLEALVLTPSSSGLQPWKFVVVKEEKVRETLLSYAYNQPQIVEASHLIVLCRIDNLDHEHVQKYSKTVIDKHNKTPEELEKFVNNTSKFLSKLTNDEKISWIKNQIYIALGNAMTYAAYEGIDSCPMEGFVNSEFDRVLGLSKHNLKSVVVLPIGFRSEEDKNADRPKVRFDLDEVVLWK